MKKNVEPATVEKVEHIMENEKLKDEGLSRDARFRVHGTQWLRTAESFQRGYGDM